MLQKFGINKKSITILLGMFLVTSVLGGCSSFRKKFVRKKKKKSQEKFVPVLVPEQYSQIQYTSEKTYKYHYSLWKVWYKDLVVAVEGKATDKRQKYLLNQCLLQLDGMRGLLAEGEKKDGLTKLRDRLAPFQEYLDRPDSFRDGRLIINELRSIESGLRNDFKVEDIGGSFK